MFPAVRNRILTSILKNVTSQNGVNKPKQISSFLFVKEFQEGAQKSHLNTTNYLSLLRYKHTSKNKQQKSESESNSEEDDELYDKNTKVFNAKVTSLRLDGILKSGLGIARNKIEVMFYESKIRLNGEKVLKKSEQVHVGDEIDIIKGASPTNPSFINVARVEILNVKAAEDHIVLKLRRCKTLLIENYKDPWKPSSSST